MVQESKSQVTECGICAQRSGVSISKTATPRSKLLNVECLAKIAASEPHAAFSALVHRIQSRWIFVSRTVSGLTEAFKPLEEAIRHKFLPALLGREINDVERDLFSLPARFAGLGIPNPTELCSKQVENSEGLTAPLLKFILDQKIDFDPNEMAILQKGIRQEQQKQAEIEYETKLKSIEESAPYNIKFAIKLAREKGASSWVTARPLHQHSTVLHKGDFRDAIYLRYGWEPPKLPEKCGCGAHYDVTHAMQCMTGGFRGLLHNEVNRVFYETFKDAGFKDVKWEPELQPLSGEKFKYKTANTSEEARSGLTCSWLLVSDATSIFRRNGIFAFRTKQPRPESSQAVQRE